MEKTATKMIVQFGSIENAHEHLEEVKPNKAKESLREHYDMAQLSKELATINTDSPWNSPTKKRKWRIPILRKLMNCANDWNLRIC